MTDEIRCPRQHTEARCHGHLRWNRNHYTCSDCRQMFATEAVERFEKIGATR